MRSLILRQLTRKFSDLSGPEPQQVNQLSFEALENLREAVLEFGRLENFRDWLARHG